MILTIIGPRSHKLFGNDYSHKGYLNLAKDVFVYLVNNPGIEKVFIGMATGMDLIAGLAIIKFNTDFGKRVTLECAIPGINQTAYYNDYEKKLYNEILQRADIVTYLTNDPCNAKVLKKRNRFMVDNSDEILAYWNGQSYKSGTFSTINYADKQNKPVHIVNPFNLSMKYDYPFEGRVNDEVYAKSCKY